MNFTLMDISHLYDNSNRNEKKEGGTKGRVLKGREEGRNIQRKEKTMEGRK